MINFFKGKPTQWLSGLALVFALGTASQGLQAQSLEQQAKNSGQLGMDYLTPAVNWQNARGGSSQVLCFAIRRVYRFGGQLLARARGLM